MFLNTCKAAGVKTADLRGGVLYDPVGKAVMKVPFAGEKASAPTMTRWP